MFDFPETQQTRNVFSEARFLVLDEKERTDLVTPNNTNEENYENIVLKRREL